MIELVQHFALPAYALYTGKIKPLLNCLSRIWFNYIISGPLIAKKLFLSTGTNKKGCSILAALPAFPSGFTVFYCCHSS
ncbi:MAG TPA: hypothetical protein PKV91_09360, partial [Bacillota bacterium]|nr:hypothetical protein [Bacillota bacterium]